MAPNTHMYLHILIRKLLNEATANVKYLLKILMDPLCLKLFLNKIMKK